MKTTLFYILMFATAAFFTSCGSKTVENTETNQNNTPAFELKEGINILYCHGTRQCPSCIAIGAETQNLLKNSYQEQVDAGKIIFSELNIDEPQNTAIAEKFEVAGSALLIVKVTGEKEEVTDLTGDGFKLARNMPDMFHEKVKAAIEKYLK